MAPALLLLLLVAPAQRHVVDADSLGDDDDDDFVEAVEPVADEPVVAPRPPAVLALGTQAGLSVGLPLVGLVVGGHARWQPLRSLSVEPHLDLGLLAVPGVGALSGQVGVPVVVSYDRGGGASPYVGVGPFVGSAVGVGEGKAPVLSAVGGEVVAGFRFPFKGGALRFQGTVFGGVGNFADFPAAGVVGSIGADFDILPN